MGATQGLLTDIAYFWRMTVRNPAFTLAVILTLGLGIGGSTAIFAVVNGVLLRPLPFPAADRLVFVEGAAAPPGEGRLGWWSQARAFTALGTYGAGGINLTAGERSERIRAAIVSASFFSVLQVHPIIGRTPVADEETPGRNRVAVLSHSLAVQNYGSARAALGQSLILNGVVYSVIGVMAPGFGFPGLTHVWVPMLLNGERALDIGSGPQGDSPGDMDERMIGRLRSGVSLAEARAELDTLLRRLEAKYTHTGIHFGEHVSAIPVLEALVGEVRPALLALSAGVLCVLLVACAGAGNLLLARGAARQKEVALRICLGASQMRVVGQLLTESVILALGGCLLGFLLAVWAVDIIRVFGPLTIPRLSDIGIDNRTFGFALCVSLSTGLITGLVPAFQAFKPELTRALKDEGPGSTATLRQRFRHALVVSEVALAMVLLTAAGLTVQTLRRLTSIAPGFDPQNVVTLELALPKVKYRSNTRVAAFQGQLLERIKSVPGVAAEGVVNTLPLGGTLDGFLAFDVAGVPSLRMAVFFSIFGDYLRAMGIPLLRGRPFTEQDNGDGSPVIIINQTLAQQFWDAKNPIGDHLLIEGESTAREIVGVVGDVKYGDLGEPPAPQFYLPWLQSYRQHLALNMTLVVRTTRDPNTLAPILQKEVSSLDTELPVFHVRHMEEVISESTAPPRFRALVLGAFALVALVLAVLGVYSVVAYSVARRSHEIAVRISLGARPRDILLLIAREGALLAVVGAGVGLAAGLGFNRLLSSLLFGITPTDATTLMTSVLLLIGGALIASAIPAIRASRIDVLAALRYQ